MFLITSNYKVISLRFLSRNVSYVAFKPVLLISYSVVFLQSI